MSGELEGRGSAPSLALHSTGRRAVAWAVPAQEGVEGQGHLAVRVDSQPVVVMADSLGPVQSNAEGAPQISFGNDSTLHIVYVVTKELGKRFPASALRTVSSFDGGVTWSLPVTVTDDTTVFGSHNFHSLHVGSDGTVFVSWLDGRDGMASTYMASSRDGGRTWSSNSRISTLESCPCCKTAVAGGREGEVFVAWRAVLGDNIRDIVIARSGDFGMTWSEPVRVHEDNWQYGGCPHAGPSIRLDPQGNLHVLWWTGEKSNGGVFYSVSKDRGSSFGFPVAIDSQSVPIPTHVQLAVSEEGKVIAVWDDLRKTPTSIKLRLSAGVDRVFRDPVTISGKNASAQYPVIGFNDSTAYVAWWEGGNEANIMLRSVTFSARKFDVERF